MKFILISIVGFILLGCGSIPQADPELIANFKAHPLDKGDDVGVYLIRPNQFAGGGRDYWVAKDDKVIGDLENNSYVFISLNSKENTSINTVVSMAGQNYIGIPESTSGEQYHFYSVDFSTWIPKKLTNDVGITLVSMLEEHKLDYKIRPNDGYDNLAMNPGMVDNYMSLTSRPIKPDNDHGVVYFFRPTSTTEAMSLPVSVWLEQKHLGALGDEQLFKVKIPVGKTSFFRKDGEFQLLEVNIEPNTYHYIELKESFSFTGYNYNYNFFGSEKVVSNETAKSWINSLTEVSPLPESKWGKQQRSHVMRGLEYIKKNNSFFITEKNTKQKNY